MERFTVSVTRHGDQAGVIEHLIETGTADEALREVAAYYPEDERITGDVARRRYLSDMTTDANGEPAGRRTPARAG